MSTYISMLRGINVSGQNLIKMNALTDLYREMNFIDVQTYIQSGNVIFRFRGEPRQDLEQDISIRIKKTFSLDIPVIIFNLDELSDIIKRNPYASDPTKNISQLYVTFLSAKPNNPDINLINSKKSPGEEIKITENAVYLYCPDGYGKTKLSNTFLENKLGVNATTRNWKSTLELHKMAERSMKNYFKLINAEIG